MGHGWTKRERIKLDFIWETLKNVSAPFRSTAVTAKVASGSLYREKSGKKETEERPVRIANNSE